MIASFLLTSCASWYKTIEPNSLNYVSKSTTESATLKYKYEVLKNKKYSKKEGKKGVKLVSIAITNHSESDLVFGENAILSYTDDTHALLLDKNEIYNNLKQQGAYHLFYLLFAPAQFQKSKTGNGITTTENVFPIGLILAPALAGGNIAIASSANKKFQKELEAYDLLGKTIKKGETKYGLVGIRSSNFEELELEIKQ